MKISEAAATTRVQQRVAAHQGPVDVQGERAMVSTMLEQGVRALQTGRFPDLASEIGFFFGASNFETYVSLLGIDPDAFRDRLVGIMERRAEGRCDPRIRQLYEETIERYRGKG